MTSNDMDQIRDLLIGEFSQEVKSQLKLLDERLTQLHEDNKQEIERVAKGLGSKIHQVYKASNEKHESLKLLLEQRLTQQQSITQGEIATIEGMLNEQSLSTQKSLGTLKSRIESKITTLQEENSRKNVSKESLASIFLEHALKLKDTTISDKLRDKLQ